MMSQRAVFLTAGAAGMYCGSCMHDNALAKALRADGVDCLLQPVYTPIRTDSDSVATDDVFFGGIHIYLLQQMPWLRFVPRPVRRMLDWPPLIRMATRRTHTASARQMGKLTLSMLRGSQGHQAEEVSRLVDWLANEIRPDAVILSNLLIGGALPELRKRLPETRLVVLLQGDDIFLDYLEDDDRAQAIELCRGLVPHVDRFVSYSRFYADKMGPLLKIPEDQFVVTPLSIDLAPFANEPAPSDEDNRDTPIDKKPGDPFRLGYFARIAPEKGLDRLVDAFVRLAPKHPDMELHVAGWMSDSNRPYLEQQTQKVADANLQKRFVYHGSPSLEDKVKFLKTLDLLSVPTNYQEPKGLFVLEALAAGVAVVQPDHGEFGELIASTGGGLLFPPDDTDTFCRALEQLKQDHEHRNRLARTGHQNVREKHSIDSAAKAMRSILFEE